MKTSNFLKMSQAYEMYQAGWAVAKISRQLDITWETAKKWIEEYGVLRGEFAKKERNGHN